MTTLGASTEDLAVDVVNLTKRYPKATTNAVDGMSFSVRPGEIFGLLGPNGAGKTTTVGILTTRVRPNSGTVIVGGVDVVADPSAAKAVLGVVPQRTNLDRSLSIRQNLIFHAMYHGISRSDASMRSAELLELFGLQARANEKPDVFSGGQAQRVMIARSLMHEPAVLFLDEPATGLDPAARLFVWERIRQLQSKNITVVLTTHDMDEAETLCDRVGIVDHGRLLALDSPASLVRTLSGNATLEIVAEFPTADGDFLNDLEMHRAVEAIELLTAESGAAPCAVDALAVVAGNRENACSNQVVRHLRLYVDGEQGSLIPEVSDLVRAHGGRLMQVSAGNLGLEDVFLHLTGKTLR